MFQSLGNREVLCAVWRATLWSIRRRFQSLGNREVLCAMTPPWASSMRSRFQSLGNREVLCAKEPFLGQSTGLIVSIPWKQGSALRLAFFTTSPME